MSPAIENSIGLAVIAFLQVVTLWLKNRSDGRQTQRDVTASTQMDDIARVGRDTHTLVNNAMTIQLTLYAKKARDMANLTHKKADIEDALLAETKLKDHLARQADVDSRNLDSPGHQT